MKKIICLSFTKSRAWLHTHLVFSKSLVFIWAMILSYGFVKIGVLSILTDYFMDYFSEDFHPKNFRKAAMVGNTREGLSSIFVVVTHFSESYVGHFNVIILCTASTVTGLMLLWASSSTTSFLPKVIFYVAVILTSLGDAMESTVKDFLEYQLEQKVKESVDTAATSSASQTRDEENDNVCRITFWWYSAFLTGSLMTLFWSAADWTALFKAAVLFMLAAYFWLYLGCFSYFFQEPSGSPLYKMYRVFKAAMWKLKLRRPASEDGYHWQNLPQKEYVYRRRDGQVRVKPHVPSLWRWLDKAAIPEGNSNNEEHCYVEEVREVKYVASLTHFGITLLLCSLVKAAGSTYFIAQADGIDDDFHVSLLLLLKFCTRELVVVLCWILRLNRRRRITIMRIVAGMICAVLCCFVAWRVDLIIRRHGVNKVRIAILIPQYILLGLTEGLACKGFQKFFCNHVPESMWSLKEAFTEFLLGVGNFLTIPYFFPGRFVDSIEEYHVHRYYLTLGSLNIAALLVFGYYSWNYAYNEGGTIEMEHNSGQSHQEIQEQVSGHTVLEVSNDATAGGTSTMVASDEQPSRMAMQQNNGWTRLISRSSSSVRRDQEQ